MRACCLCAILLLLAIRLEADSIFRNGDVRLVGGDKPNNGRVEVYYDGQWGTVCDDNWDLDDALVICRSLGFANATRAVGNAAFGTGSGPILLDDVTCQGTESSLALCKHKGWKVSDCQHSEDAGVECQGSTDTQTDKVYVLDYSSDFSEALNKLYDSKWHCDFRIRVVTPSKMKNTTICTHQLILAMNTNARFLLKNNASSYTMKVDEECLPYVDDFIRYLYSKKIEISLSSVRCMHQMASLYGIAELQEYCSQLFSQLLPQDPTFKSQIAFYNYAVSTEDAVLKDLCLQYLAWNCEAFTESPAWLDLSAELLQALLFRSDIIIHSERTLLQALESWILAHNDAKSQTVKDLIGMIRFPMILPEELFEMKFTLTIYSIYEKLFHRVYQQALEFHTVGFQKLGQHVNISDSSYIPRIYTSSTWSYLYNRTSMYSSNIYNYGYNYNQYGLQNSFQTPRHTSFLFMSQTVSWTSYFYPTYQSCRNYGFSCHFDTFPVLGLSPQFGMESTIQYQNKAVMICKNSYVSHVQDFKDNFATVLTNNISYSAFPCDAKYSPFRYVIRPVYVNNYTMA